MSVAITVLPDSARNAGCSAQCQTASYWEDGGVFHVTYNFVATPADGWMVDYWTETADYKSLLKVSHGGFEGTVSLRYNGAHPGTQWDFTQPYGGGQDSRPDAANGLLEFIDDYSAVGPEYRDGYRMIASVGVFFKRIPTGLILRAASSGVILRSAGGTILHDA